MILLWEGVAEKVAGVRGIGEDILSAFILLVLRIYSVDFMTLVCLCA